MSGPNSGWNPDGTPKADADQQQSDPGQPPAYKSPLEGYPGYAPPTPMADQPPMPPPYPGPEQAQYGGPPQQSYPPPAPPPSRRGPLIRWGIILLIAVVVGGGFILFRDRLSGNASELAVGDCIDEPTGTTEISDVQHQPCNEPHDGEVFAVITHTAASGAVYPPSTEFQDLVSDECLPALEAYVGRSYQEVYTAGLDVSFFYPSSNSWSENDREVTCFLVKIDGSQMTGSVRAGAATPSP